MSSPPPRDVSLAALGECLASLRLRAAGDLTAMRRSLARHGQLTPVCVFEHGPIFELIDGFKRVVAARELSWTTVRATVLEVDAAGATAKIVELHGGRMLAEIEQGWIVRALHREHGLTLGAIGMTLGRDKSWAWRRLLLVEGLTPNVQADVRLGLLAARAALAVAALPRGNDQEAAAQVVSRRGLTVRQTELLVEELLDAAPEAHARILERWSSGPPLGGGPRKTRAIRSPAEALVATITMVRRGAGTLQGQLAASSSSMLEPGAMELLRGSLRELGLVLALLVRTIAQRTGDVALGEDVA